MTVEGGDFYLQELAGALSAIGASYTPQISEQILSSSPEHRKALDTVHERLPAAVYRPISEFIIALTDPESGLPGTEQVNLVARSLGTEPGSYSKLRGTYSSWPSRSMHSQS